MSSGERSRALRCRRPDHGDSRSGGLPNVLVRYVNGTDGEFFVNWTARPRR